MNNNNLDIHIGYAYRTSDAEHEYANFKKVRSKVKVTEVKISNLMIGYKSLGAYDEDFIYGVYMHIVMLNMIILILSVSAER